MCPHHCVKMQGRGRQYKGTGCNHRHKCVLVDTAWGLYTGVFTYELRATRRRRGRIPAVHLRDATLTYKRARTHAKQSDTNGNRIIFSILKIGMLIKLFYSIRFHNFDPRCAIELYKMFLSEYLLGPRQIMLQLFKIGNNGYLGKQNNCSKQVYDVINLVFFNYFLTNSRQWQ